MKHASSPLFVLLLACNGPPVRGTSEPETSQPSVPFAAPSEAALLDAEATRTLPAIDADVPTPSTVSTTLPQPSEQSFVVNPSFPDCIHPGVSAECSDGWCRVPAGCFVLGSDTTEPRRARYTEERARVTLTHDFEIQQTELTLEQWQETGWEVPNRYYGGGTANPEIIPACMDPRCPANSTTWYQALQYANWLSEQRGLEPCVRVYDCVQFTEPPEVFGLACYTELLAPTVYECEGYRLPTSAEWEYAARAGTTTAFYSGDITSFDDNYVCQLDPNLAKVAWYCGNAEPPEKPVAQLLPNQWGLYDVLGNVDEWTMDRARGLPLPNPSVDPEASYDSSGGVVTRSCSVNSLHAYCRSAAGLGVSRDSRFSGIRLVRTLGVGTLPTLGDVPLENLDASVQTLDASAPE